MDGPLDVGVASMRATYLDRQQVLNETDLVSKEPIGQFKEWFEQARNTPAVQEANAMCLSTANSDGAPSARFVLMKGFGVEGFKFFTNHESRKGRELAENPRAALTFYWDVLHRSVRVEGKVEKLSESESDDYFHSRPVASQIGACASSQSKPITGRDVLTKGQKEVCLKYNDGNQVIPRPRNWGGYIVIPHSVEFWQGQSDRLHDRIRFRRPAQGEKSDGKFLHQGVDGWVYERLSP